MVNGVESNSKFPHFEGILRLDAALQVLYALPVLVSKLRIIVGQQRGSLEGSQIGMHERRRSMLPAVDEELHCPGPSIVRILNNLLQKTIQSYVIRFWLFLRDTVVIVYLENLAVGVSLENRFYRHRQWRAPLPKMIPHQFTHLASYTHEDLCVFARRWSS